MINAYDNATQGGSPMRFMASCAVIVLVVLGIPVFTSQAGAQETVEKRLNAESVHALLDLVDTIVSKNPEYEQTRAALKQLSEEARRLRLDELSARNASDPGIRAAIDAFLTTETRVIYFRRFRNVTPDHFRRAFLALPYHRIAAPGDIAAPFYELVTNRGDVRAKLDRLVARTDLQRCLAVAGRWLPDGEHILAPIFVVYDNNAGSYTAERKAFYNLYSGEGASELGEGAGEAIIAHEVHHVLAGPYLMSSRRRNVRWELDRLDMIVRNMVSEGAAMHCNPPTGFKKALFEDPGTVASLVAELNRKSLALLDGEVSEEGFREWYGSTYHDLPLRLLQEYAKREAEDDDGAAEIVRARKPQRPDLVHALGWWMLSRISAEGEDPEVVKALVQNPYALFTRYNETAEAANQALRIDPRVVEALVRK
jgi:hypothetical protein